MVDEVPHGKPAQAQGGCSAQKLEPELNPILNNATAPMAELCQHAKLNSKPIKNSRKVCIWIWVIWNLDQTFTRGEENGWRSIRTKALLRVISSLFCHIYPSRLLEYPRLGLLSCWSSQTMLQLLGWLQMMNHFYTVSNAVCQRHIQSATFCFSLNRYNNKKETTSPGEKWDTISHHQMRRKVERRENFLVPQR